MRFGQSTLIIFQYAPNASFEAVRLHRDRFIALMCYFAGCLGGAKLITINYDFLFKLEDLEDLGYADF